MSSSALNIAITNHALLRYLERCMGINLPALRLEIQADLIGQELVQQGFTEIRLGNIVYGIESTDQARDLGIDYILKTVYSKKVNKEGYPKSVLPFLLHPQKV